TNWATLRRLDIQCHNAHSCLAFALYLETNPIYMSLGYVIKEGFAGFSRARLASFTAVFSLFVAILLLGVLARVSYNAYELAQSLKQSIDIEVFLNELDDNDLQDLRSELEGEELIQEVS